MIDDEPIDPEIELLNCADYLRGTAIDLKRAGFTAQSDLLKEFAVKIESEAERVKSSG